MEEREGNATTLELRQAKVDIASSSGYSNGSTNFGSPVGKPSVYTLFVAGVDFLNHVLIVLLTVFTLSFALRTVNSYGLHVALCTLGVSILRHSVETKFPNFSSAPRPHRFDRVFQSIRARSPTPSGLRDRTRADDASSPSLIAERKAKARLPSESNVARRRAEREESGGRSCRVTLPKIQIAPFISHLHISAR